MMASIIMVGLLAVIWLGVHMPLTSTWSHQNLESVIQNINPTFTVEPGIYLPGIGGIRIEDDVVITKDGSESLTSLPRDWQVVG